MRRRHQQFAGIALAASGLAPAASAQWNFATRFGADPPVTNADYGRTAAIDAGWAAIGAHRYGTSPSQAGAVFLYSRSGVVWAPAGMLQASDRTAADDFGGALALRGGWLAVGAPLDDPRGTNSGSAYLFQNGASGWSEFAKLTASDGGTLDQFGFSCALAQDWAIVGAPFDDDRGTDAGAAYLFHFDGAAWTQTFKLTPGLAGDQFGFAASAAGDAFAVGAPFNDGRGADSGAVYVYRRNESAWVLEATLQASDGVSGDRFGGALSLEGDTLVVGANRDDRVGALDHGSAYVFRRSDGQWSEQAKLVASDSAGGDFFGTSVSLHGDWVLLGSNFDDDHGTNSGSAYLFGFADGAWSQMHKFTADDGATQDFFGSAVALGDLVAMIGAPGDDEGADASGSMYLYGYTPPNQPPTCTLPEAADAECSGPSTTFALDGSGAEDPDGDSLAYLWAVDDERATIDDPAAMLTNLRVPSGLECPFVCQVTLTVTDPHGEFAVCHMDVMVHDTTAPSLTCPAQVTVAAGDSLDPADIGAAEASDCDPQVALTYSDEELDADCGNRLVGYYVRRTWTATDHCGNSASCQQMIEQQRETITLDVHPGECPNRYNPRGKGHLELVLMGSPRVSADMFQITSIRLARADCLAGAAQPCVAGKCPLPQLRDVGAPRQAGERCPRVKPDGIPDLVLNFDAAALDSALQLTKLGDQKVILMITGFLTAPGTPMDGVEFVATDTVELQGSKPKPAPPGGDKKPEPAPAPLPAPVEDVLPAECGVGASMAVPLTSAGLLLTGYRRRRR